VSRVRDRGLPADPERSAVRERTSAASCRNIRRACTIAQSEHPPPAPQRARTSAMLDLSGRGKELPEGKWPGLCWNGPLLALEAGMDAIGSLSAIVRGRIFTDCSTTA
jgi:hypothetical protein